MIYFNEKAIADKELSFEKLGVLNGAKIILVNSEGGGGNYKMWQRFPRYYLRDYYWIGAQSWDGVAFIPKRDVKFFGFGIMQNYYKKDVPYVFAYAIGDGELCDPIETTLMADDMDREKGWWTIVLKDYGKKPIKVSEGT